MRLTRHLFHLDLVAGALGLALVGLSLVDMSTASAAGSVSDGSDWGAQGVLSSDSSQSARWDNTGNSADSIVPRDASQTLPHTGGKTYADVASADRAAYNSHFSGLQVSVSQTEDLVNQAVTVDFSGAVPDIPRGGTTSNSYFQVFQCWGAMGADGHPDPDVTSPDPQSCQVGAFGSDTIGGSAKREYRIVAGDPLVTGGDWDKYNVVFPPPTPEVPFLSIAGEESGDNLDNKNTFFNHITTNEYSHVTIPASGETTRQFEMQTSTESQGLGCGERTDQVSTASCWLVVVPRVEGVDNNQGPISPTVWAQRMQFKLQFQDSGTSCGSGARSLLGGSEMLTSAASSWIPGICSTKSVGVGYNRLGDEVARNQYITKASDAILTSTALPAAQNGADVPVALTAPVVAFNIDYHPVCSNFSQDIHRVNTEDKARACGYDTLADLQADLAKEGQPIRDLRLDATVLAKLLTMSYQGSIIGCEGGSCTSAVSSGTLPAWTGERPASLADDPEFRALNPQLHLAPFLDVSDLVVEAIRTDAAAQVWKWLLADPDSSAFLAGCPDANGTVINPFYSTRTYAGCTGDATELAAQNAVDREATSTPSAFVDLPATYPPDGSPYPLPQWQQRDASNGQGVYTLVDQFPRVDSMLTAARDVGTGYKPRNSVWCDTIIDTSCQPAPGRWKDPKTPQTFGTRAIMTLTDTPSAARFQLPTAALCDDAGAQCVQADTGTLQTAAEDFVASSVPGFAQPPATNDFAGGAYPLALPVYAVVRPTLTAAQRTSYADALDYITANGQVPGYDAGALPPGYAPLTEDLAKDAVTGIKDLRKGNPTTTTSAVGGPAASGGKTHSSKPSPTTSDTASATPSSSSDPDPTVPGIDSDGQVDDAPSAGDPSAVSAAASPSAAPATTIATVPVSASTESYPGWLLPLGVGLALGAGAAGPFLRRRSTLKVGR